MSPEQVSLPPISLLPKAARMPTEFGTEWKASGLWEDKRVQSHPAKRGSDPANASQSQASQGDASGAWRMPGADRSLEVSVVFDVCPPEAQVGPDVRSGGDFADVIPLRGDWVALVLADVCSKGPAAALCVPQTLYALRRLLCDPINHCIDPACVLNRLNRHLCSAALPASCASAALTLIVMDTRTGGALSACAGSEPPLILRAGGQAETVGAGRIALGVDADRTYQSVDFLLGRGDALLLATDGITQAQSTDSAAGEHTLNYEGLTGLALNAFGKGRPAGRVARAVLSGARAFAGGTLQDHASILVAARW